MIVRFAAAPPAARPGRRGAGAPPSACRRRCRTRRRTRWGDARVAQPLDHGEGALAQRVGDLAVAGGDRRLHGKPPLAQAPPEPAMMSRRCRSVVARGSLPGETFGEPARRRAQRGHQRRRAGELEHSSRQPLDVAVADQEARSRRGAPSRAVPGLSEAIDGVPQAAASITVIPQPSLGEGNRFAQAALQQRDLLGLAHEAVEPDRTVEPELRASRSSVGSMVAGAGDVERQVRPPAAGEGQRPNRERYSFITLQPSNVQEGRDSVRGVHRARRHEAHRCPRPGGSPGPATRRRRAPRDRPGCSR